MCHVSSELEIESDRLVLRLRGPDGAEVNRVFIQGEGGEQVAVPIFDSLARGNPTDVTELLRDIAMAGSGSGCRLDSDVVKFWVFTFGPGGQVVPGQRHVFRRADIELLYVSDRL